MGKIVGIFGESGDGKTTATIINPDGTFDPENYNGLDPNTHCIINLDRKALPFPGDMWSVKKKNYIETSSIADIRAYLTAISKAPHIKSVSLDTLNLYMAMKEYNDRKKLTFDQWRDISNDIIELNTLCNTILRDDQIAYIMGHVMMQTGVDGAEKKVLSVIGKKLTKTQPEGFYPICLFTRVESDGMGDNKHWFQTKAAGSSAKTPIGMFKDFEIPNSLKLVDQTIREYYKIK